MAVSFLTNLNEEEFKIFLRQALTEIMGGRNENLKPDLPDILDVKQAANYLRLQVTTLYEKTSLKTIPHFKKGNKLYFNRAELQDWIKEGKVKTCSQTEGEAISYLLNRKNKNH
jgi:excisionase family DNA binding protein